MQLPFAVPNNLCFLIFFALPTTKREEPKFYVHEFETLDNWWTRGGSNSWPSHCERDALPAELRALVVNDNVSIPGLAIQFKSS